MDTEFAGESSFQGEQRIGTKNIAVHSDFVEEDSDAKITLAVTSDEDSKDSGKNSSTKEENNLAINKNIIMEKITEHDEISPISRSSTSSKRKSRSGSGVRGRKISSESDVGNNPVKRKFSHMDCSSDEEEEFYGFEEESGLPICGNGYKKIKTNPEEDPNNDDINKNTKLEKISIKDELDVAEIKLPLEERSMSPKESLKQEVDVDKPQNTPLSKAKTKDLNYRKPFDMGWKREFVLRAMPGLSKEKGEVYYISPSGKKLRTRTEVLQHLAPGLTLDNFTFSKEPLGFEEEVIRSAKPSVRSATSTPVEVIREPLGKRIPKPKAPKGASPPPQGWTAAKAVKSASVAQSPRPVVQTRPDDSESKTTSKSKAALGKSTKKGEPCTIQCALAMGMIPQLQCVKCLCLFHHECVGLNRSEHERKNPGETSSAGLASSNPSGQGKYICELCDKEPNTAQTSPSNKSNVTQSPSKTQPTATISSQNPVISGNLQIMQRNKNLDVMPAKDLKQASAQSKALTMVSMAPITNLTPPNSNNEANIEQSASLPQSIAVIKGRKYVVIRKPNTPHYKRSEDDTQYREPGNENSTIDSTATPSLQTGDDLPIRKRVQNSRNKFSTESSHQSTHQQNNQQVQQVRSAPLSTSSESFAANFFSNVSLGYDILFHIFQYLKVQELLRAACVCRVWYIVGNHRSLWKTVRMKNSQVNDWTGLAAALRRNETKHLDLRKMLISSTNAEEMWASFSKNIQTVVSLETIDLCRCSSKIVESLFNTNPNLKVLNAVTIKDDTLTLENLNRLENLQELRLKSIDGCNLDGNLMALESLKNLRHLSLTSFRLLGLKEIEIIGELDNLESLELGECSELGVKFSTDVLPKLVNLERLRLEKGQGECCTIEILEAVSKLEKLVQLELVNFDIKTGFDEKLGQCKNIKRLLLIPTYISQSATTNNIVLTAVLQLTETLQTLTWAVTLELLRVTALYVDQCDNKKKDKKFFDESIPVLKPVPGIPDDNEKSQKTASDVPQVEILPLVKVEKILTAGMPTTKFKILKVPYHATWRQNLVDMQ